MTDNACIYAPVPALPWAEIAAELAPGAELAVGERVILTWPDLEIALATMPGEAMPSHLAGFRGYIRGEGGAGAEALATRVLSTRGIFGIAIEPALDERAMRLLSGLTAGTDGLLFLGGEVFDARGKPLLLDGALDRPEAPRVAARALVLLACAFRALLEQDAGGADAEQAEGLARRLATQVEELPAARDEREPAERRLLETPLGALPPQQVIDAVWASEGACVLLWALGARSLGPHDRSEHPFTLCRALGFPGEAPPALLEAPRLRPGAEIDALQSLLRGLHWRLREFSLSPTTIDFEAFTHNPHVGAFTLGDTPLASCTQGRDLTVQGELLPLAPPEAVRMATSIAIERHRAGNWLLGCHPLWSRVDTPT